MMEVALKHADEVYAEGRDRVQGLRSPRDSTGGLPEAIEQIGRELRRGRLTDFRFEVSGSLRPLHEFVRDESYLIVCEAMTNAFRHAQAAAVQVRLTYDPHELCFLVRDDGHGIDSEAIESDGSPGHWGPVRHA